MRFFLKILLTVAIGLNLLGAVMPPRPCGMPCCRAMARRDALQANLVGCSTPAYAPKMPPCCKMQTARKLDPATLNSPDAGQPSVNFVPVSGPSFAANTFAGKAPVEDGSPPGASRPVPVYKMTSSYLC